MNFVDLDFAMIGPVVRDISASFDRFWNSAQAWPMQTLDPDAVNEAALAKVRAETRRKRHRRGQQSLCAVRCGRTTAFAA